MPQNLVNSLIDKFNALAEEEKNIHAEKEVVWKEYNDYCSASDSDLSEKLTKLRKKIAKMEEYMRYAAEHTSELEEATEPFETGESTLVSLQQSIGLDSHNDASAETLYTKASAQKLFYEHEINRERTRIEGSKVQAQHQYDAENSALIKRQHKHDDDLREYIESDEFRTYLKKLTADAAAFNSTGILKPDDCDYISLGQRRVRLPIPEKFEQELTMSTAGVFNSAAKTIGAPVTVPMDKGSVLMIDYDDRNETYLMGGIQRLLLNAIKYFGQDISSMFFCEPQKFSPDCLGHISGFAKGINPFMIFPTSFESAKASLDALSAEMQPTQAVTKFFVFHCFPEAYDDDMKSRILDLCNNAEQLGAMVVLTHKQSEETTPAEDEARRLASVIRSRNGGFYLEETKQSLFWYSAPSDIPDEIRRVYVEQRRQAAIQRAQPAPAQAEPVQSAPVPAAPVQPVTVQPVAAPVQAAPVQPVPVQTEPVQTEPAVPVFEEPAPDAEPETVQPAEEVPAENISRALPAVPIGTDITGNTAALDIESGTVVYICGNRGADRASVLKQIINTANNAEIWAVDLVGSLSENTDKLPAQVKYLISGGGTDMVCDIADRLCAERDRRADMLRRKGGVDLPELLVVVNGFGKMYALACDEPEFFGRDTAAALRGLFAVGGKLGMHFVLAAEKYEQGVFADGAVHTAVALPNSDENIAAMFGKMTLSADDITTLSRIPTRNAVIGAPDSAGAALTTIRIETGAEFTSDSAHSTVIDRRSCCSFDEKRYDMSDLIAQKRQNETLLFLGEPCRVMTEYPVRMSADFAQNLLMLTSMREVRAAADAVMSVIGSISEQGQPAEILTATNDPVYGLLCESGLIDGIHVSEGTAAIVRIKELAAEAINRRVSNGFAIVLGADRLVSEMVLTGDGSEAFVNALANSSRMGRHFVLCVNSVLSLEKHGVSLELFGHRAVFSAPVFEAGRLLDDTAVDVPAHCFRLIDRSGEVTMMTYSHDGI